MSGKNCLILDFDGTLYYNPKGDFGSEINENNIIECRDFFAELDEVAQISKETDVILLTGRHVSQKDLVLEKLLSKGYYCVMLSDHAIFNDTDKRKFPFFNHGANLNEFLIDYWAKKAAIINELRKSGKYENITIVDDDTIMIAMLKKLNFTVVQASVFQGTSKRLYYVYFVPGQKGRNEHYTNDEKDLAQEYYDYASEDADKSQASFTSRWILTADACPECCGPIMSVEKKELEPNKYHEIFVCEKCGEHYEFDWEDD